MNSISPEFADNLRNILVEIYALQEYDNRSMLLRHLPLRPVTTIKRSTSPASDLNNIVAATESWGQLTYSGAWALAVVARNALQFAEGTQQGHDLASLLSDLELQPANSSIPPVKEVVIGQDERLPVIFLTNGLEASSSVAKVLVKRVFSGKADGNFSYGTGWLIAPGVLVTNHHVIAARSEAESPVAESDFLDQASQASVWFGYDEWDRPHVDYGCTEVIWKDVDLDCVLLRIADLPLSGPEISVVKWSWLSVLQEFPKLKKGDRLNIIQHPLGGPKRLAIRSNFYVENYSDLGTASRFRYLSDTEPGSSGSPIFTDSWQVVGLHHAAVRVPEAQFQGRVIKFNNQGVRMSAIIDSLPQLAREEIGLVQGWR